MKPVFLDTVGLIALWNMNDQWHQNASQAFMLLNNQKTPLITTSYVLAECGNAVARTAMRASVEALRMALRENKQLIFPTREDWHIAWNQYCRGAAGDAGIVDQLSFAVMRRLGVCDAFTNDRHFAASGFNVLF